LGPHRLLLVLLLPQGYELMGSRLALRYPDRIPAGMGISRAALKAHDLKAHDLKGRFPGEGN